VNKFKYVLSKLNVPPNIVVVFDNEETEIEEAKNAGIKIINPLIT
jgi:FMN phosphatase YigB (HAD superfamily)